MLTPVAPAAPSMPVVAKATSLMLNVSWAPIPLNLTNGIITNYLVYVTYPNSTESVLDAGNSLYVTIPSLTPGGNYIISVSAITQCCEGAKSPALSAWTLDAGKTWEDGTLTTHSQHSSKSARCTSAECHIYQRNLPACAMGHPCASQWRYRSLSAASLVE